MRESEQKRRQTTYMVYVEMCKRYVCHLSPWGAAATQPVQEPRTAVEKNPSPSLFYQKGCGMSSVIRNQRS